MTGDQSKLVTEALPSKSMRVGQLVAVYLPVTASTASILTR